MDLDEVDTDTDEADALRLPDPNADKANLQRGKSLEALLMAKNRKIQDELTGLRVRCLSSLCGSFVARLLKNPVFLR
jgi:homeobox protein cut-like